MRILFVSNFYPPYHIGGYEQSCREAAQALTARGHEIRVLTSTYGVNGPECDGEVYRWLETDIGWGPQPLGLRALRLLRREVRNQWAFRRIVTEFKPDLVYLWNLKGISISIALRAQRANIPTCFYVGDTWLESWRKDQWYALWPPAPRRRVVRVASRALRSLLEAFDIIATGTLELREVQFASHFLKRRTQEAGEAVANADVVYWGVDVEQFPRKCNGDGVKRLLFVGQVVQQKGVHTAVEALRTLVRDRGHSLLKLTIIGGSIIPEYVLELRQTVRSHGLQENVEFVGPLPRERLPEVYRTHDVLLLPSIVDEGLGLTILEGMAAGLAVLGTASGGSAEILEHEITGLVFPKEDAETCAAQILRLIEDRRLFDRLRENGRRAIEERFRLDRLMVRIEDSLHRICTGAKTSA
jgi:glycogen(starch) synthase